MSDSTIASRAFGRLVRKYRKRAGLPKNAVAFAAETSPQTYGRLEDGLKQNIPSMMVNVISDKLRVSDDERRLLLTLAEETRKARNAEGKWWRSHLDEQRTGFRHYLNLEQSARRATSLQIALIPGLLQATEYRRQLVWAAFPQWTPAEVEESLALAALRRERLADPDFEFRALISEAVLRQRFGGPAVLKDQLSHLLEASERPNVSVRAIPFTATNPVFALGAPCVLFEFGPLPSTKLIERPMIFVEELAGALYLERRAEMDLYMDAIRRAGQLALDVKATRDLILGIVRECSE
ncbi:helix-turn-helix domain-containing protein [Nocardia pseudobrasiliensis]|uniref:Helix-turn-helix protein n=1 Tax=Nocardia pseudobrasiliensis TaxID=45979 RepID=A0A370I2Z2_9NOCA|nr:helix-turn-helix transcriptional regulator [Nocardia pseudobrasiliensis]RDI65076.1 helix-turn-helix protein [Nocardia pseudobrasiliensis]